MKYIIFASSSSGNCSLISDGTTNLLIDAGISARRITASLADAGFSITDIHGVLITHEHSDHTVGLKTLCRKYSIPVYASPMVAEQIRRQTALPELPVHVFEPAPFPIGTMTVTPFPTPHDSVESFGFRISSDAVFALATDMGYLTQNIVRGVLGADVVLIEANHDIEMVKNGPYPYPLKRRILSDHGHLCNAECGRLAAHLSANGTKTIILGHLSQQNNTPETAYDTVRHCLPDCDVQLCCAPVSGKLEINF